MRLRGAVVALVLVCLFMAAGCETAKKVQAEFDPSQRPIQVAYEKVINKYLANQQRHDAAAMVIMGSALPLNWDVRQAMVVRRADAFGLTENMQIAALADEKAEFLKYYDIVVSIYLPDEKWNNLSGQNPNYRVYLVSDDGRAAVPVDRRRIRKRSAINMALYPFWGQWSRLYKLRFPLLDENGRPLLKAGQTKATLVITGAPGSLKMPMILR